MEYQEYQDISGLVVQVVDTGMARRARAIHLYWYGLHSNLSRVLEEATMGKRKYEADEAAEKEYKENIGKLAEKAKAILKDAEQCKRDVKEAKK